MNPLIPTDSIENLQLVISLGNDFQPHMAMGYKIEQIPLKYRKSFYPMGQNDD